MRKVLIYALGIAVLGVCGSAMAQGRVWDDLSWWAQSGATPEPVKDATRSGYWWWPTEPASNVGDSELWGNRGVVYAQYTKPAEVVTPKPPPPGPKPTAERKIPVLSHVLFDFDKSDLKPEGKAEADKVVEWMKKYEKDTVIIEGHTCNIGTEEYNMGLGQHRADAVMKYLVGAGVAEGRVTTVSYGESRPVSPESNATPASRKQNRRAVFVITLTD